jgi:hypothetical protein
MSQNPQAQLHVATQLTQQSKYLQSRPFIHSSANIDKIIYRFNKEKSIIHVNGSGNGSGKKSECVSECVSECESDNEEDEEIEFGWGLSFDPLFISQLAIHGFLPMAGQCFADLICLLPKLHLKRCVMADLSELKVSRGARKRSRHYEVTIDQAFDEVITAIQVIHAHTLGGYWYWYWYCVLCIGIGIGIGIGIVYDNHYSPFIYSLIHRLIHSLCMCVCRCNMERIVGFMHH